MPATNNVLTASVVAKEAVMHLENELVAANLVHRAYEEEFQKSVNGYKVGATVTIKKPTQFTFRSGAVAASQDVTEGTTSLTIDQQGGVDFEFTSKDLTLSIPELGERIIKPAMITVANQIDVSVASLCLDVPNYVGTPGTKLANFAAFARAPERMDETAIPQDSRSAILNPSDYWGMVGSMTGLYVDSTAKRALERAKLPILGNVQPYMAANATTLTTGTHAGAPLVNGAAQVSTYLAVKDTGLQNLITDAFNAGGTVKKGEVFNIAGVFDVNPVTKAVLPFLKCFVVKADATADGVGNATLSIAPAIIVSGAFQNCSAAPADNAALTFVSGAASTNVRQNVAFKKEAFALAMAPLEKPPGAVQVSRRSYKGIHVRVIPFYDGINDISRWRLDVLWGVKTVDARKAVRFGG